jgi:hypothetical protein
MVGVCVCTLIERPNYLVGTAQAVGSCISSRLYGVIPFKRRTAYFLFNLNPGLWLKKIMYSFPKKKNLMRT